MKTQKPQKPIRERDAVNQLIKALSKNTPDVYIYVDRDAGGVRHTRSGWDFLLCRDCFVIFVEAKVGKNKLTDWQYFTKSALQRAGCIYKVLRFAPDGESFQFDDSEKIYEVRSVCFKNFLDLGE